MAPQGPVIGTYRRYKAGTEKLRIWLRDNSHHTSKLRTDDFVPAAKVIAQSFNPRVEIPLEILDITYDAIQGRKSFGDWFAVIAKATKNESMLEANSRHAYFLKTLQEVYDVLRSEHKKRRPKRKKALPQLSSQIDDLANLYQHLDLQDTGTDEAGERTLEQSTEEVNMDSTTRPSEREPVPEDGITPEDEYEQIVFEIWSLLKDLYDIRLSVQRTWKKYLDGDLSLLTASRIAEAAMEMSTNIGKEFCDAHLNLGSFDAAIEFLGVPTDIEGAGVQLESNGDDSSGFTSARDLLCLDGWSALRRFRDVQWYLRDVDGIKHVYSISDTQQVTPARHPFAQALLSIAEEIKDLINLPTDRMAMLRKMHGLCTAVDHYTNRLWRFGFLGTLEIGLVNATQIYMDMYDALDGDFARGAKEARPIIKHVKAMVDEPDWGDDRAKRQLKIDTKAFKDLRWPVPDVEKDGKPGWDFGCDLEDQNHVFVSENMVLALPLLPLTKASKPLLETQHFGNELYNSGLGLLTAAHLYKASKRANIGQPEWTDMEMVVKSQEGRQAPFARSGETDVRGVAVNFSLALGVPLTTIKAHRAQIEPKLPTGNACQQRAVEFECRSAMVHAKSVIFDRDREAGHRSPYRMDIYYEAIKAYLQMHGSFRNDKIRQQWTQIKKFSCTQLLQVLEEIFVEEEPLLHFEHMVFAIQVTQKLTRAALEVAESSMRERSSMSGHVGRELYEAVHTILWEAAWAESEGIDMNRTRLCKASKVFQDFIKESGDARATSALKRSSGHLSEEQKPERLYPKSQIDEPWFLSWKPSGDIQRFLKGIDLRRKEIADKEKSGETL